MTQHGMGDEATIKDIISEVDTDHVSWSEFNHGNSVTDYQCCH